MNLKNTIKHVTIVIGFNREKGFNNRRYSWLGMSIATRLAKAGAEIIINDLIQEKLDTAIAEYAGNGIKAHGYLLDVTDEAAVKKYFERLKPKKGKSIPW